MIEGLKVTVKGEELIVLCRARASYHQNRTRFYAEKVEALKGVDMDAKMSGGNPAQQLEAKQLQHEAEGQELLFIADHLVPTELYILARPDLQRIGKVKDAW